MITLVYVLIPILALFVGGALYRLAYALPRRSFGELLSPTCHACGDPLPTLYLIPLVGTFLNKMRCPVCGEKRGVGCFLSEVTFAVAALLLELFVGLSFLFLIYLVTAALLLILSLVDLDIKEVPHGILFGILLLGVLLFVLSFFPSVRLTAAVWWEHLVGAFIVSLPLFIVMMITGGGIGGGDIKLMFCLGLLLGYKLVLIAFLFGIAIAALVSVILLLAFGKDRKFEVPLVAFLAVGFLLAVLVGDKFIALLFA